jgi:putative ABC transport system substrate-binding protein
VLRIRAGEGERMRRRDFLAAIAGATTVPAVARAAQRRDPVVGYLYAGVLETSTEVLEVFWKGLVEQGYVRGRNVAVEYREAQNDLGRLPDLARDLVSREVSVIAVPGSAPAVLAAKAATVTIPIVFFNASDPVRLGFVASLSRPGGNITGVSDFGNELTAKRLELIKMLVPTACRVGILVTRGYTAVADEIADARRGAPAPSLETVVSIVGDQREIDAAFASFTEQRMDAAYIAPSPLFASRRQQVVALAARHRLPAIYPFIQFPRVGGLMSYGTSLTERSYQAGLYTGLILNGANPAELPVHRLSRFELVINMRTAGTLGLTVPPRLLAITDQVIE